MYFCFVFYNFKNFEILVTEIYNLEIYLYGLDSNFFGHSVSWTEKTKRERQQEYKSKSRDNFQYCDCEKCAEVEMRVALLVSSKPIRKRRDANGPMAIAVIDLLTRFFNHLGCRY